MIEIDPCPDGEDSGYVPDPIAEAASTAAYRSRKEPAGYGEDMGATE